MGGMTLGACASGIAGAHTHTLDAKTHAVLVPWQGRRRLHRVELERAVGECDVGPTGVGPPPPRAVRCMLQRPLAGSASADSLRTSHAASLMIMWEWQRSLID